MICISSFLFVFCHSPKMNTHCGGKEESNVLFLKEDNHPCTVSFWEGPEAPLTRWEFIPDRPVLRGAGTADGTSSSPEVTFLII